MCEPYLTLNILQQTSATPDPALASAGLVKNINDKKEILKTVIAS